MNSSIEKKIVAVFGLALLVAAVLSVSAYADHRRPTVLLGSFSVVGMLGLLCWRTRLDMRARRHAEAALRATDEFNLRIIASSGDGIAVLSLDGTLLMLNTEGRRSLAVDEFEHVRGSDWAALWLGESASL